MISASFYLRLSEIPVWRVQPKELGLPYTKLTPREFPWRLEIHPRGASKWMPLSCPTKQQQQIRAANARSVPKGNFMNLSLPAALKRYGQRRTSPPQSAAPGPPGQRRGRKRYDSPSQSASATSRNSAPSPPGGLRGSGTSVSLLMPYLQG